MEIYRYRRDRTIGIGQLSKNNLADIKREKKIFPMEYEAGYLSLNSLS